MNATKMQARLLYLLREVAGKLAAASAEYNGVHAVKRIEFGTVRDDEIRVFNADLVNADWYDWDSENETLEMADARRRASCPRLTATQLEALWQLRMTVWDGYLISKSARDYLVDMGLAQRLNGWQFITRNGMAVLDVCKLLEDDRYGTTGFAGGRLMTLRPEQFARLRAEGLLA